MMGGKKSHVEKQGQYVSKTKRQGDAGAMIKGH